MQLKNAPVSFPTGAFFLFQPTATINLKTAVEMLGQAASLVQHGLQRFDVKDGAVGAKLLKLLPFKGFSLPAVVN